MVIPCGAIIRTSPSAQSLFLKSSQWHDSHNAESLCSGFRRKRSFRIPRGRNLKIHFSRRFNPSSPATHLFLTTEGRTTSQHDTRVHGKRRFPLGFVVLHTSGIEGLESLEQDNYIPSSHTAILMRNSAVILVVAVTISQTWGFSVSATQRSFPNLSQQQQSQYQDPQQDQGGGEWRATPQATQVSVCTAELCCCQEDGVMGGNEILATLLSRKLPYPVDEAPCLGACGGGAMVVIDFEDGSSALVSGIDETLMELGLLKDSNDATVASSPAASIPLNPSASDDDDSAQERLVADSDSFKASLEVKSSFVEETLPEPATREVVKVTTTRRVKPSVELVDVRERMRAEAAVKATEEESVNPWLNAASYLAGKAAEKLFGDK